MFGWISKLCGSNAKSDPRFGESSNETNAHVGETYFDYFRLTYGEKVIVMLLKDVLANARSETTVLASVVAMIVSLRTALDAAIATGDPADLQALSAELDKHKDLIAQAVAAGTIAASPVENTPTTPPPADTPPPAVPAENTGNPTTPAPGGVPNDGGDGVQAPVGQTGDTPEVPPRKEPGNNE